MPGGGAGAGQEMPAAPDALLAATPRAVPDRSLSPEAVERVCRSALRALWARLRPSSAFPELPGDLTLREDGLGLDSLELLEAVADANARFALHETGTEDHLLIFPTLAQWAAAIARHIAHEGAQARIRFATSGSTDAPRQVEHSLRALDAEVAALRVDLWTAEDAPDRLGRIVALVPCHHIFGFLFTALLPDRAGVPVVDLSGAAPGAVTRVLRAGDALVATPFLLDLALRAGTKIPEACQAIVSGAPMPVALWRAAQAAGLAVTEVYGATETGGIGLRRAHDAPFELLSHLARDDASIRACGPDAPSGPLPVQDRLAWHGPRQFRLEGRRDAVVQIGGVNVSPEVVARHLRTASEVADAAVRFDPQTGRLKALIVPHDPEADRAMLTARLDAHANELDGPARPRRYDFGDALPRGETGKPADW